MDPGVQIFKVSVSPPAGSEAPLMLMGLGSGGCEGLRAKCVTAQRTQQWPCSVRSLP